MPTFRVCKLSQRHPIHARAREHPAMRCLYVSLLTTDDYIDGILVLCFSLQRVKSRYGCLVLITPNISIRCRSMLHAHAITYKEVQPVCNPTDIRIGHRWYPTYTKLRVFGLAEWDKLVYLDADMLILENLDHLFEYPHMSATNAGGMLPEKYHWKHMNSGLFVATPSTSLLTDMLSQVGNIEILTSGGTAEKPNFGSDQDFLNAYYHDWPERAELHLDHKYNILHYHLDAYNRHFGYTLAHGTKRVAVVHYGSYLKPWNLAADVIHRLRSAEALSLEENALRLWLLMKERSEPASGARDHS